MSDNKPEGVGTGAGEGAPRQDTGSAWVTRSADCPEAPAQAHPLDLDALAAVAQAATPGEWRAVEGDLEGQPASEYVRTLLANREADGTSSGRLFLTLAPNDIDPENGGEVVPALTGDGPRAEANAEFIATFSPPTVLALLAEVAALRQQVAEVEAERDDLMALAVEDTRRRGEEIARAEAAEQTVAALAEVIEQATNVLDGAFVWLHGYAPEEALLKLIRDLRAALESPVSTRDSA